MFRYYQRRLFGLILCIMFVFFAPLSAQAAAYSDLRGHWAAVDVVHADSLGLVAGYEDATFRPDNQVTRAEFVAFVNRAFTPEDATAPRTSAFTDVAADAWYSDTIRIAETAGLLKVYSDVRFEPNKAITRQEVAAILSAAMQSTAAASTPAPVFTDEADIEAVYRDGVTDMNNRGLLAGYPDGSFKPLQPVSRAEAIVLLLRAGNQSPAVADPAAAVVEARGVQSYLVDPANNAMVLWEQSADGLFNIGTRTYALAPDHTIQTGWITDGDKTHYATLEDGLARGWQEIEGQIYYFQPYDFAMLKDGARSTGDGAYYFSPEGVVQSGHFPTGYVDKPLYWEAPGAEEMNNAWLTAPDAERRFKGQAIANFAAQFNGLPFKWFGTDLRDPTGVYCCGAAYSAYREFGIAIPGPEDTDMHADEGYRMVKDQYLNAPQYGGAYVPTQWDALWPGDLTYSRNEKYGEAYHHVSIYLGQNGGRAIIAHATLADGFVVEPTDIVTDVWGYVYLDTIRYV